MRRRLVIPLAVLALVAGQLGAADAAPAPQERGYGGTAAVDVPIGGAGYVTSGELDARLRYGRVAFRLAALDDNAFAKLAFVLAAEPTPARRILACAFMSRSIDLIAAQDPGYEISVEEQLIDVAAAKTCVRLAQAINAYEAGGRPTARAAKTCVTSPAKIRASYEHTDTGWTISIDGGTLKPAGKASAARVSCRAKGHQLIATVRPKSKRATLRSVVGKNHRVAIVSPPDAEDEVTAKVTFTKG